jgi:hypothetical protein
MLIVIYGSDNDGRLLCKVELGKRFQMGFDDLIGGTFGDFEV